MNVNEFDDDNEIKEIMRKLQTSAQERTSKTVPAKYEVKAFLKYEEDFLEQL